MLIRTLTLIFCISFILNNDLFSQEIEHFNNLRMNMNYSDDDKGVFPEKIKSKPEYQKLSGRIIASVGYSPNSEDNLNLSLAYLNELNRNFYIGGGLDYYVYAGAINLTAYYGIPVSKSVFDFMLGGGVTVAGIQDNAANIYPLLSIRSNLYLSSRNSFGVEIKTPFVGKLDEIPGDVYFMANVGLIF